MDALSNLNDFASPWLFFPSLLLAGLAMWKVRTFPDRNPGEWRGISTGAYAVCLVLASVLAILVFAPLQPTVRPWGGADGYFTRAVNLVTWGVYGYGDLPSAYFPPGYSFLLAPSVVVLGPTPWAFFSTNLVLLLGSSIILRWMLIQLGVVEPHANVVAGFLVLIPNHLLSTLLPFSDIPFALLWMLAFGLTLLSTRRPDHTIYPVLAGLCAGMAALTRSQGLLLLLPLVVGAISLKDEQLAHRLRRSGLILATALLVITPWIIRNYSLFGQFVPISTNGGFNLAIGHNPTNSPTWNPYADTSSVIAERIAAGGGMAWNESQRDSFFLRQAVGHIAGDPAQALVRGTGKVAIILVSNSYSFGFLGSYSNIERITFIPGGGSMLQNKLSRFTGVFFAIAYAGAYILNGTVYYLLLGMTILLLWKDRRRLSQASLMMLMLIILVCLVTFVVFGLSRYKEPVGVVMLAYAGIMMFVEPWKTRTSAHHS